MMTAAATAKILKFPAPEYKDGDGEEGYISAFWPYLAGLIDGDGTITFTTSPRKKGKGFSRTVRVSLTMCDLDILEHVRDYSGRGKVYVERRVGQGNATKTAYRWAVHSRKDVRYILDNTVQFLGIRKAADALKVADIIAHWESLNSKNSKSA